MTFGTAVSLALAVLIGATLGALGGGGSVLTLPVFVFVAGIHDLKAKLDQKEKLTVLYVRTETEWNDGHIDGAIHVHGGSLQEHFEEVPRDKPVAIVCGSGYRASIAGSFLQRSGFDDVSNVVGGMSAWKAAKLPTET